MATPPSASRGLGRSASQRPSTPDQTRPSVARTASGTVAPKSEYLRNALQARRAQHMPTPAPLDTRAAEAPATTPANTHSFETSPDIFAEFALSEAQTTPVSPIRRRRPSDVGLPRTKTNRELTIEIEKLKDALMTSNMRVELLKKNNSELQHDLTKARERVEDLEPLEEENNELKDENNYLRLKIQEWEEIMVRVKDDNDALRKSNEDMLSINVECSSHWEDQEFAVQEAADTIIALETEKQALASEVKDLRKRVVALEEDSSRANTLVDGSTRCPSRIYSIDESRPSTSHFDSDYYSQPDSPHVKDSRESVVSVTPSERSKRFLDSTQERRRSARDLAKRMSAASLKALRITSPSPTPEVPQIPAIFQQQIPRIVEQVASDKRASRTPKRYRERRLPEQPILDALQISPTKSDSSAPHTPTPRSEGLRGLYRPDQVAGNRTSNETLHSSSHGKSPTTTARPRSRKPSGGEISPRVPSRLSSKHAHTNSSSEGLSFRDHLSQRDLRNPRQRRQSEPEISSAETAQESQEEWASMPPPPVPTRTSLISEADTVLTSELDPQDRDRWWKSMDRLSKPRAQTAAQCQEVGPQTQTPGRQQQTQRSPTLTRSNVRTDVARSRTQPNTPAATTSHDMGRDFFFNGAEDEDTFMRKAKARLGGSRR
ncbi:hypothetical protein EK21DRAFT_51671 [Setomelanomma holmii]|uniref:Uncharacterized protein n=1 Tax=Setomelanomma holmii TaxID=210430 RepID=A0A9P4HLI1_9PLEO|nr:hypothetical protein EK21DRAFT_51671 [Setomelanomma holmii]